MAKTIFAEMVSGDERMPRVIAASHGLAQITGDDELRALCLYLSIWSCVWHVA